MDVVERSKLVAKILRHQPGLAGLALDEGGWVEVEALLEGLLRLHVRMTREQLEQIVITNKKRRFRISDDGLRIRASQGHTLEVELGYKPQRPPPELFHGTVEKNRLSIETRGLDRMKRTHVHLSADRETAHRVGMRFGKPLIVEIDAAAMHAAGLLFYRSENGVWLTEAVPPAFLRWPP